MDKQTTFGFILIALVLIVWMWLQAPPPAQRPPASGDTTAVAHKSPVDTVHRASPLRPAPVHEQSAASDSLGKYFSTPSTAGEKILTVKTDLYTAEITTKGALVRKWELTRYKSWDGLPVQLVDFDHGGDFSLMFLSSDGKRINTRSLMFAVDAPNWKGVELSGDQTFTVEYTLAVGREGKLVKRLTFTNGKYSFDVEFLFQNLQDVISNYEYQVVWEHGLRYAEHNSVDESSFATAYAYSGGEVTEVDATKPGESVEKDIAGNTGWVAARTKYFAVAMLPAEGTSQGAYLEGTRVLLPDHGDQEVYSLALKMPFKGGSSESGKVTVFLGPLDFDIVKGYHRNLEQIMSLGAAWIIRPIAEYLMLPLFEFLRYLIPNYGLVIIVFSIIIKVVLHPLTKTSMKSMKKMQALTPMMNEIREKYKDDPQKMNQQIMNLYKEYGVNPAAGCLPLLLQMPILFALYAVFRSSIGLRQADFVWWIKDLSIPDSIGKIPFTIPFFNITEVSGLAVAMGVTMFLQQKMTVTDPRQKTMVWMMPILMTLVFNSLPSGLNLYYFVFNLLSIGQQMWITKQHGNEPLRKVEVKKKPGGIMARLTKDLPKMK